jgi:hypothetical protein
MLHGRNGLIIRRQVGTHLVEIQGHRRYRFTALRSFLFHNEASTPCFVALASPLLSQSAAAAEQPDKEQHDGDDYQHVDQWADRERPDESQQPGDH